MYLYAAIVTHAGVPLQPMQGAKDLQTSNFNGIYMLAFLAELDGL